MTCYASYSLWGCTVTLLLSIALFFGVSPLDILVGRAHEGLGTLSIDGLDTGIPARLEYGNDSDTKEYSLPSNASLLELPTFWSSHMALQRSPAQARIWGLARAGAAVNLKLVHAGKILVDTTVQVHREDSIDNSQSDDGERGKWVVNLPPQEAGTDFQVEISEDLSTRIIVLEDIAFGDVFLCSGQSNMQMTVPLTFNATSEMLDAENYPHLRLATVAMTVTDEPKDNASSAVDDYIWARSSLQAINYTRWKAFSATCYYFGRHLYASLNDNEDRVVPIGLVAASWGGQRVETFSSPAALADTTCGGRLPEESLDSEGGSTYHELDAFDELSAISYHRNLRRDPQGPTAEEPNPDYEEDAPTDVHPNATQIWKGMIHPLIEMRFAGAVWYQGEANSDDPIGYSCRFPAMITDWRRQFDLPDMSFCYVELASYEPGNSWPKLRAAQAAALDLPKVGMATAIDLSDPTSPNGAIHPRRKQEVGRRLSLAMQALHYEVPKVWTGPKINGVQLTGKEATTQIRISFLPGTAGGLHFAGTAACTRCCDQPPFSFLTQTGQWTTDAAVDSIEISTETQVMVVTTTLHQVFGLRYAWEASPECALYNLHGGPDDHDGIAMAPFEWCALPSSQGAWTGSGCRIV